MTGRPTKLTPEVKREILRALSKGGTLEMAAGAAGVGLRTVKDWLARGRKEKGGPFRTFRTEAEKARQRAGVLMLSRICKKAKEGDLKAMIWFMERVFSDDYSGNAHEIREIKRELAEMNRRLGEHESRDA